MEVLFGEELSDVSEWDDEDAESDGGGEAATAPGSQSAAAAVASTPPPSTTAGGAGVGGDGGGAVARPAAGASDPGEPISMATTATGAALEEKEATRCRLALQSPPPSVRHNVVALVSGGKDSIYAMVEAVRLGHTLVCVANLHPADEAEDDVDSWTYQTVGHGIVPAVARALELPLVRAPIAGACVNTALAYSRTEGDEVEDLHRLLVRVRSQFPQVTAVLSGAVLSTYQRTRVEDVCARLGLVPLAFLWQRNQRELVEDLLASGVEAVVAKVACLGLRTADVGRPLRELLPRLVRLHDTVGVHVAGEGGEYETLTLDAPIYRSRIEVDASEVAAVDDNDSAPVALLRIQGCHLVPKSDGAAVAGAAAPREAGATAAVETVEKVQAKDAAPLLPGLLAPAAAAAQESAATERVGAEAMDAFRTSFSFSAASGRGFAVVAGPPCGDDSGDGNGDGTGTGSHGDTGDGTDGRAAVAAAFAALGRLLRRRGLDFQNVVHIRVSLRELRYFTMLNAVFSRYFGGRVDVPVPSRSCVASAADPSSPVVLRCVLDLTPTPAPALVVPTCASLPEDSGSGRGDGDSSGYDDRDGDGQVPARPAPTGVTRVQRTVLHVRSISRWAPVCIGPYSQSNQIEREFSPPGSSSGGGSSSGCSVDSDGDSTSVRRAGEAAPGHSSCGGGVAREVYLAGQIALVPETMDMLRGGGDGSNDSEWRAQLRLAVRNIAAVLACSGSDAALVAECRIFVPAALVDGPAADGEGGDGTTSAGASELPPAPSTGLDCDALRAALRADLAAESRMCTPRVDMGGGGCSASGGSSGGRNSAGTAVAAGWQGLITVFVVDALPRAAAVEVEVVAAGLTPAACEAARRRFRERGPAAPADHGGGFGELGLRFEVGDAESLAAPSLTPSDGGPRSMFAGVLRVAQCAVRRRDGGGGGGGGRGASAAPALRFLRTIYAALSATPGAADSGDPVRDVGRACAAILTKHPVCRKVAEGARVVHVDVTAGAGLVVLWEGISSSNDAGGGGSLVAALARAVRDGCRAGMRGSSESGGQEETEAEAPGDESVSVCVTRQVATTRRLEPWDVHLRFRVEA